MAYELAGNLLSDLIRQQRQAKFMQKTPQFQQAVDELFANRLQVARNQLILEKLDQAQTGDQVLEAIKSIKPELYVKRKREQIVGDQILDILRKTPEEERDYGLINYLAGSIGYGDVGPIEQAPLSESRFQQELKLRKASRYGDRFYTGAATEQLRAWREARFKDWLDQGILFEGKPATDRQIQALQSAYLKTGEMPEGFNIEAEPLKPQRVQRPTKDIMETANEQVMVLLEKEKDKLHELGVAKRRWGGVGFGKGIRFTEKEKIETLENLIAMEDTELEKLTISNDLKDYIKLFKKYGLPKDFIEKTIEPSEFINQQVIDPNNPMGFEFE